MPASPVLLPNWLRIVRNIFLGVYLAVGAGCLLGAFGMMGIGAIVYRDFGSYSLAGNPWHATSFPWYVIWPMRLMSILGVQLLVAVGYAGLFIALVFFWPSRLGSPMVKLVGAGVLALLLELAAAAWFGRWFG